MLDFDVILHMDWLFHYHEISDCYANIITLIVLGIPLVLWQGAYNRSLTNIISFMQARQLFAPVCLAYLAYFYDVSSEAPSIDLVPVVHEFL